MTWLLLWILLSIPAGMVTGYLIETPDDNN
jgi:hypothetical protein